MTEKGNPCPHCGATRRLIAGVCRVCGEIAGSSLLPAPMRLTAPGPRELKLRIDRYEFPDETGEWDANWLAVTMHARHPRGHWAATGPYLLTWEVESLAGMLERLADGDYSASELRFIEPCLEFTVAANHRILAARLGHEFSAPWQAPFRPMAWAFPTDPEMLRTAGASLREHLSRFPQR